MIGVRRDGSRVTLELEESPGTAREHAGRGVVQRLVAAAALLHARHDHQGATRLRSRAKRAGFRTAASASDRRAEEASEMVDLPRVIEVMADHCRDDPPGWPHLTPVSQSRPIQFIIRQAVHMRSEVQMSLSQPRRCLADWGGPGLPRAFDLGCAPLLGARAEGVIGIHDLAGSDVERHGLNAAAPSVRQCPPFEFGDGRQGSRSVTGFRWTPPSRALKGRGPVKVTKPPRSPRTDPPC